MSWLGSLVGPLQSVSGEGGGIEEFSGDAYEATASFSGTCEGEETAEKGSPRFGEEDRPGFTKSLSSKLWGVASLLGSPSSSQTPSSSSSPLFCRQQKEPTISGDSDLLVTIESSRTAGIRSDFEEIGGTLKTGIVRLSNNVAINGISKIAYKFLSLREEEEDEVEVKQEYEDEHFNDVIGITDEVLAFARNIACHPETWLDFPLLSDDEAFFDDFDMSVAQQAHALVIESLAPRLAALRIELCPTHMSAGCFWKVYFALLHPRLNKHDAGLLSTPQVVEARAMLQHGFQNRAKQESEHFRTPLAAKVDDECFTSPDELATPRIPTKDCLSRGTFASLSIKDHEPEKRSVVASDAEFVDKFVVREEPLRTKVRGMLLDNFEAEEDDEWPEDETQDLNSASAAALICNEEDISFSDLEDSDECSSFSKSFKPSRDHDSIGYSSPRRTLHP